MIKYVMCNEISYNRNSVYVQFNIGWNVCFNINYKIVIKIIYL